MAARPPRLRAPAPPERPHGHRGERGLAAALGGQPRAGEAIFFAVPSFFIRDYSWDYPYKADCHSLWRIHNGTERPAGKWPWAPPRGGAGLGEPEQRGEAKDEAEAGAAGGDLPRARKDGVRKLGWPKRCQLAHAFRWECGYKRLQLAQLLGQLRSRTETCRLGL